MRLGSFDNTEVCLLARLISNFLSRYSWGYFDNTKPI